MVCPSFGARDQFGADDDTSASAVLHHDALRQALAHLLGDQARWDIRRPAGGEGDDHTHRSGRPLLRARGARQERGAGRGGEQPAAIEHHGVRLPEAGPTRRNGGAGAVSQPAATDSAVLPTSRA